MMAHRLFAKTSSNLSTTTSFPSLFIICMRNSLSTRGKMLTIFLLIASVVLWREYSGDFITIAVPCSCTFIKEISFSSIGFKTPPSPGWRESTKPDFSPSDIVKTSTSWETDKAASLPIPFLPIFLRPSKV